MKTEHSPGCACAGRRRGIVMVITLMAVIVLAALVFYVLNLGRQANARVVTQHGADSAAAAGAGWVARSMNTVAMNNVAISRYLATVNTLDAFPLTTRAAFLEQSALLQAIGDRHFSMVNNALSNDINKHVGIMTAELQEEVDMLRVVNDFLEANPNEVPGMTRFDGPNGRGLLWRSMEALDELSVASMENLGPLAQLNAMRGGEINLLSESGERGAAALMVPIVPRVPWQRGRFDDFERPVKRGRLPRAADHDTFNRGPYDTVFGWRNISYESLGGGTAGGGGAVGVDTGGVSSPFGGSPPSNSTGGSAGAREPHSYNTFGTQTWTMQMVSHFASAYERPSLFRSRFATWCREMSYAKLGYVWPDNTASGIKYFAEPRWVTTYPSDLPSPNQPGPQPISETAFFRGDYKANRPFNDPSIQHASAGYFIAADRSPLLIVRQRGWWLPLRPGGGEPEYMHTPMEVNASNPDVRVFQLGPLVWLYQQKYTVLADPEIGISAQYDKAGNPVPQPAYFIQLLIYAGVNRNLEPPSPLISAPTDDDFLVTNPYEGFDRNAAEAPAPVDIDRASVSTTADARRIYLTYLGVARQGDKSLIWSSRFKTGQPYDNIVAVAQAKVFNDHSWDLWTQMWHAQLEPVTGFDDWLTTLDQGTNDVGQVPGLSAEEVVNVDKYLHSVAPLAPNMLNH